jgi:hypothetical protein
LAKQPPAIVTDNYCFVVDGDVANLEDTISRRASTAPDNNDIDNYWKPTGKAVKYYYSSCLKKFYPVGAHIRLSLQPFAYVQVQIVKTKGKILSACMRKRRDVIIPPEFLPMKKMQRSVTIDLKDVFQVSRYYSCWRSCLYFHRIVSLVEPLQEGGFCCH